MTGPGWLLVCSDGLWNYASEPDRARGADRARRAPPTRSRSRWHLVAFANAQGGQDNITVALARVEAATGTTQTCQRTRARPTEEESDG